MNDAITNHKMVTLVVSVLFFGGLAAVLGMYRAARHAGLPSFFDQE